MIKVFDFKIQKNISRVLHITGLNRYSYRAESCISNEHNLAPQAALKIKKNKKKLSFYLYTYINVLKHLFCSLFIVNL